MLCRQAEETVRQAETLQSDMKKAEAKMRAVAARLWLTEKKASRLHRKLQSVGGETRAVSACDCN